MSPRQKIPIRLPGRKEETRCPHCNFPRFWKHSHYTRKGFHRPASEPQNQTVDVLRYLCRNPPCERTFSILPEDVLPYCRFCLSGLLSIAEDRDAGVSAYQIAKSWMLGLPTVLRAIKLIKNVTPWLAQICHGAMKSAQGGFRALVLRANRVLDWPRLTRHWYHAFYPRRVGHIVNPHNLAINST